MKTLELQKGIWQLFLYAPNEFRSFQTIDTICRQLYGQNCYGQSEKAARYQLFYPLLRYGVVEFYGNNQFALSPTTALESKNCILLLHVPDVSTVLCKQIPLFSYLGISLYAKSAAITSFLKDSGVPANLFRLQDSLNQFSSFEAVINGWQIVHLDDLGSCYYFTESQTWQLKTPDSKGIYKTSVEPYSQKMLFIGMDQWKNIPKPGQQIDGFTIARIWGQIQTNTHLGITYYAAGQKLVINTPFFPLLLERLLFINTLLKGKSGFDQTQRQYSIDRDEFNLLNHLFENRINLS